MYVTAQDGITTEQLATVMELKNVKRQALSELNGAGAAIRNASAQCLQ